VHRLTTLRKTSHRLLRPTKTTLKLNKRVYPYIEILNFLKNVFINGHIYLETVNVKDETWY